MRASSFGSCIRAQVAEALGYKPQAVPEKLQAAFDRGNTHEEECAAALRADGWFIWDEQREVECEGITGHLDGLIRVLAETSRGRVWEAKAPNAWAQYERAVRTGTDTPLTIRYKWQTALYMHATGLEQMVSCFDGERVKSFVIEVPPFTLDEIRARKAEIEAATSLPADCEPGCFDDWGCPFRYLHVKPEVVDNEAVDRLVVKYERSGFLIKEMKENQAEAKAELEKLMVFDDRIETESSIVTKYEQAGPKRYDMDAVSRYIESKGGDLDYFMLPETKSPRMKITRKRVDTVTPDVVVSTDTTEGETDDHDQRAGS